MFGKYKNTTRDYLFFLQETHYKEFENKFKKRRKIINIETYTIRMESVRLFRSAFGDRLHLLETRTITIGVYNIWCNFIFGKRLR